MTAPTVLPSRVEPVVAGAVEAIGGTPGRHARLGQRRFWTPVRVLLVLVALVSLAGFGQKAPCRNGSSWQHEYQYTRACYTDVVALYSSEGLSDGKTPYYQHPVEYPVVIGAVMDVSSALARIIDRVLPDRPTQDAVRQLNAARTADDRAKAQSSVNYAHAIARGRHFYDVTWALMTGFAMVVVIALSKLSGRRPWDAALFALSPALLLHATTNWDLVAVAFATLGLLAWARKHPAWAGVLLGLGTATKLYPVLFLVPLAALCWRAGKMRALAVTALLTVVAAVGLTLPVYLTSPGYSEVNGNVVHALDSPLSRLGTAGLSALKPLHCQITDTTGTRLVDGRCPSTVVTGQTAVQVTNAVYRFFDLNQTRGADWDSLYLQLTAGNGWNNGNNAVAHFISPPDQRGPLPGRLNHLVEVFTLLVLGLVTALVLLARRRPRLPQVLFLTLAGFLLVNKVDSPQYVLWLVPLAVLARPRWRPFFAWQLSEVLVLFARFYFFIGNDKAGQGIGIKWFFAAILLRDFLVLVYCAFIVRDIAQPSLDAVRDDGVDDPAGGVLDGALDRSAR